MYEPLLRVVCYCQWFLHISITIADNKTNNIYMYSKNVSNSLVYLTSMRFDEFKQRRWYFALVFDVMLSYCSSG